MRPSFSRRYFDYVCKYKKAELAFLGIGIVSLSNLVWNFRRVSDEEEQRIAAQQRQEAAVSQEAVKMVRRL